MSSAENPAKPVEETKAEVSHHTAASGRNLMPAILPPPRPSGALALQRYEPSRQLRAFMERVGWCMARRRSSGFF